MQHTLVSKEGFQLRAVQCPQCKEQIIHPADLQAVTHFDELRGKTFSVKLRMVGNSHAISIPKEIVDFMNEQHRHAKRQMADMVRLCFEDARTLSVLFDDIGDFETPRTSSSWMRSGTKVPDEPQSPLSNRFETKRIFDSRGAQKSAISDDHRRTSKLEGYSKLSIDGQFSARTYPRTRGIS